MLLEADLRSMEERKKKDAVPFEKLEAHEMDQVRGKHYRGVYWVFSFPPPLPLPPGLTVKRVQKQINALSVLSWYYKGTVLKQPQFSKLAVRLSAYYGDKEKTAENKDLLNCILSIEEIVISRPAPPQVCGYDLGAASSPHHPDLCRLYPPIQWHDAVAQDAPPALQGGGGHHSRALLEPRRAHAAGRKVRARDARRQSHCLGSGLFSGRRSPAAAASQDGLLAHGRDG